MCKKCTLRHFQHYSIIIKIFKYEYSLILNRAAYWFRIPKNMKTALAHSHNKNHSILEQIVWAFFLTLSNSIVRTIHDCLTMQTCAGFNQMFLHYVHLTIELSLYLWFVCAKHRQRDFIFTFEYRILFIILKKYEQMSVISIKYHLLRVLTEKEFVPTL